MAFKFQVTQPYKDDMESLLEDTPGFGAKLAKTCEYLGDDPRKYQSSLQTIKLRRLGPGSDILKSRVDQSHRIAWSYDGPDRITLWRVGQEEFINNLATFGDGAIVEELQIGDEPVNDPLGASEDWKSTSPRKQAIYANISRVHLRLLGVPEEQTREVQRLTDVEEVHDLGLPDYAVKNLVDVYLLQDLSAERLFDPASVFYRTNAEQMEGYCRGEIKRLLLALSPEQERLVNLETTGPTLIKGVAGSGKTTIGVYRAMGQALEQTLFSGRRSVLFVTYTQTLARVVEQMFVELYGQQKASQVQVWVLRDWLQTYLEGKPSTRSLASAAQIENAISSGITRARSMYPEHPMSKCSSEGGNARGNDYYRAEINDVIKGRNLRSWDDYARVERVGRKTGLRESQRRFVWAVYEEYERYLHSAGVCDYLDLAIDGTEHLARDDTFSPFDVVIVDEAQDLRPVELQVTSALAGGSTARGLVLLADPAQSIYYRGIAWKEGHVHIAGARSFLLARNYRNTRQILSSAWCLAESGSSEDPDEEYIVPEVTDRVGPKPIVVSCENPDFQKRFLVRTIVDLCQTMRYRPGDIAVMARRTDRVRMLAEVLRFHDLPAVHYREPGFDVFENVTKVVTINSAKGLEFPVVFLVDLDEGELPRHLQFEDEDELEAELRAERRLFYVGMTRAANRLYMTHLAGAPSRFLDEISAETVRTEHYPEGGSEA